MKLKEYVLSANTGLDAIKRAPIVDYDTGLKCIRIQDISQNKSFEDWGDTLTTSSDYTKFRLCTNDILVARTGATVGVSYIVLKDYNAVFNNGTIRLKLKGNCNPKFIYYVLQTREFMQYIDNVSCVATQPNLRVENLLRFYIPDLSIEKQNSIVNFLSTYDELIENNNKRIKILEQMAENLYKEWFVRFRNPDKIKVKIGKVGDLCSIKSGYAFKSEDWQDVGCKVVKIKDLDGSFVNLENLDCVPEKVAQKAKNFMLQMGDLTIAMTGATIGKIGLVNEDGLYANQRVGKFFVDKRYVPYLYCFFKQEHIIESIIVFSGSSSAQPNISGENLEKINMPYDKALIDKFSTLILPLFQQMINIVNQNQNLIKQRDMLLPRLMSGKLEVKEEQEKVVAFKPKKTFAEFKSTFAAAARKDGGLTEQDMEELYKAYCDDSRDE